MTESFARQAREMFGDGKDARIPDNVHAFAEEGIAKTREAYQKINTVAKDSAKVLEQAVLTAQAGATVLGEKLISNANTNTEAAFDAVQAIARARTLPEVARLQADFMQQQLAIANAQTKELFDLSAKFAKQTFETVNSAANKTLGEDRLMIVPVPAKACASSALTPRSAGALE
jgi:phasin